MNPKSSHFVQKPWWWLTSIYIYSSTTKINLINTVWKLWSSTIRTISIPWKKEQKRGFYLVMFTSLLGSNVKWRYSFACEFCFEGMRREGKVLPKTITIPRIEKAKNQFANPCGVFTSEKSSFSLFSFLFPGNLDIQLYGKANNICT